MFRLDSLLNIPTS